MGCNVPFKVGCRRAPSQADAVDRRWDWVNMKSAIAMVCPPGSSSELS
jgi:hypothetical protein